MRLEQSSWGTVKRYFEPCSMRLLDMDSSKTNKSGVKLGMRERIVS